jgi:hypothetical protein
MYGSCRSPGGPFSLVIERVLEIQAAIVLLGDHAAKGGDGSVRYLLSRHCSRPSGSLPFRRQPSRPPQFIPRVGRGASCRACAHLAGQPAPGIPSKRKGPLTGINGFSGKMRGCIRVGWPRTNQMHPIPEGYGPHKTRPPAWSITPSGLMSGDQRAPGTGRMPPRSKSAPTARGMLWQRPKGRPAGKIAGKRELIDTGANSCSSGAMRAARLSRR